MCIKRFHDITFAVIDMEDSIASAALLADKLERYLNNVENYSDERVTHEINRIQDRLDEAKTKGHEIKKGIRNETY